MCGIAGIVRAHASPEALVADLARMWPGIASRGPDGRGELVAPPAALLHSRLAIIDLVTGDQPIWNERRTVACILNGEIYNYRELRERLLRRGHRLATTSDTEVLVHLYEDHGADLVEHVHGMYALAVIDSARRRLLVARDRLGMKPVFLADLPDGVAFASAIPSLLALGVPGDPDEAALAEYLRFYRLGEPRTAYRSVRTLLPGHRLLVDLESGRRRVERFHRLRPTSRAGTPPGAADGSGAAARDAFARAVRSHLVADVEVGAFLSGGVDSSLVVAEAQRIAGHPLRTFCFGFGGDREYCEARHAERVAAAIGARHRTIEVTAPPAELVRAGIAAAGQPFGIASFLPMLALCREACREVKVVLTGDGGDEVGLGYPWYRWMSAATRWPRGLRSAGAAPAVLRRLERGASLHPAFRHLRRALKFARGAVAGGAAASDAWRYEIAADEAIALLRPEHRAAALRGALPSPTAAAWDDRGDELEALRRADMEVGLRDEMLPKSDRAGMAFGLEARVPLLDDEVVEAMLEVPLERHAAHPEGKALLRSWAAEALPGIDWERPKHGFDVPMVAWLRGGLREDADRLLLRPAGQGLTEAGAARALWDRMLAGSPNAAHSVYAALVAELWFERRGAALP